MRRLLSVCLFLATLLPLLAALLPLGAAAQAGVPVCCRRGGKHHCMSMGGDAASSQDAQHRVGPPREMCPYPQRGLAAASHHEQVGMAVSPSSMRTVLHEPNALSQVECLRRISFDRSRQKRGPPSFLS